MKRRIQYTVLCAMLFLLVLPVTVTAEETVHIGTPEELRAIAAAPDGTYMLDADIDLADTDWTPFRFSGTLDGNGHSIRNLHITEFAPETGITVDGNGYKYKTHLASFISVADQATVRNIRFEDATVYAESDDHAFASIVAAVSTHSVFENISVSGTVTLYCGGKMAGVGGMIGFGTGSITDSDADITLVYVDTNKKKKCEQFLGGAVANGFMDCENVTIRIDGYASVFGYAHCGGLIGMHRQHEKRTNKNAITHIYNNTVSGRITFFEKNTNRRAYCKGIIGERLNKYVKMENNDDSGFERNEIKKYDQILLPENDGL